MRSSSTEIVGLSGTSGGAICALLAWSALARATTPPAPAGCSRGSGPTTAATAPSSSCSTPGRCGRARLQNVVALPAVSPYDNPFAATALDGAPAACCSGTSTSARSPAGGRRTRCSSSAPSTCCPGHSRRSTAAASAITADDVLASAAIPTLFRVRAPRRRRLLGRPVLAEPAGPRAASTRSPTRSGSSRSTPRARDASRRPWSRSPTGATSSPATCRCTRSCTSSRRSTSCSRRACSRPSGPLQADHGAHHRAVAVAPVRRGSGPASKLNRDPAFIAELIDARRRRGRTSSSPRSRSSARGAPATPTRSSRTSPRTRSSRPPGADGDVAAFVRGRLADGVTVDATRKQVARDGVTWTVRVDGERSRAHAELRDGRITRFVVG